MEPRRLLVFVKAPEPGSVKTRLAAELGHEAAASLYAAMLRDLDERIHSARYTVTTCAADDRFGAAAHDYPRLGAHVLIQRGAGLGERMRHAFEDAFADNVRAAILIGSDIPGCDAPLVERAFATLESADAVLGPAVDGGYYLIGFRRERFCPEVFSGIPWSTGRVARITRSKMLRRGLRLGTAPRLQDVDTADDLLAVLESPEARRHHPRVAEAVSRLELPGHHARRPREH